MKVELVSLLVIGAFVLPGQAAEGVALKTVHEKSSYGFGYRMGTVWKNGHVDVDFDLLMKGLKDGLNEKPTLMQETQINSVLATFRQAQRTKQMAERKVLAAKNLKISQAFLAKNAKQPGVKSLPSGLQYQVLRAGDGPTPQATDTVTVNYRGMFPDGKVFDSSYKRGTPATLTVNRVLRGWTEALQLMKVGAKWKLFLPPDLAFGARGIGTTIPPNQVLVYEVELLKRKPAPKPKPVTSDIIRVPSAAELKKGAKIQVIKKEDLQKYKEKELKNEEEKKTK